MQLSIQIGNFLFQFTILSFDCSNTINTLHWKWKSYLFYLLFFIYDVLEDYLQPLFIHRKNLLLLIAHDIVHQIFHCLNEIIGQLLDEITCKLSWPFLWMIIRLTVDDKCSFSGEELDYLAL